MRFFWQRGLSSLRKEIILALLIKLVLIFVIWMCCFSDPPAEHLTAKKIQQHLMQ